MMQKVTRKLNKILSREKIAFRKLFRKLFRLIARRQKRLLVVMRKSMRRLGRQMVSLRRESLLFHERFGAWMSQVSEELRILSLVALSLFARQSRSIIVARMRESLRRVGVVVLAVSCATSLFAVGYTNAGFSDVEESQGNTWVAGSLDARATYIEHFDVEGMNPDQAPDHRITFKNVGSLDFRYGVKYRKTAGDDALCTALHLVAEKDGVGVYAGPLSNFDVKEYTGGGQFLLPSLDSDNWDFTATLPSDAGAELEHLSCQWSFDFTAWQPELANATLGFSDVEAVDPHVIATGEWLTPGDVIINEVMWMGSAGETRDEWIELKNMTDEEIDLSNWNIRNAGTGAGSHVEIPSGYSIKANGYFLVMKKKWNESALYLTGDLPKNKGYTHVSGMSLDNDGEQLTLEDPDGLMLDRTPAGAWPAGSNGTLKQSMERNDVPGDGTVATNWHACVSGSANGLPYWDATGNNYGTPLAANLSPIVMNEFVMNPVGDDDQTGTAGEWVELYNILDTPIDVAGWYFTNDNDDRVVITDAQTTVGATFVPGHSTLVVTLDRAFLDNDEDHLSLYAPGVLPDDATDDVREDTYHYAGADILPEGKSFARFPDGEGIWIDPVATPGEENELLAEDVSAFRRLAYETCFIGEKRDQDATEEVCSPLFLAYIGLLDDAGDDSIETEPLLEILEMIRLEEEAQLLALLKEEGTLPPEEETLPGTIDEPADTGSETSDPVTDPVDPTIEPVADPSEGDTGTVPPTGDLTPVEPPVETPVPDEETSLPTTPPTPDEPVATEPPVTEPETPAPSEGETDQPAARTEDASAEPTDQTEDVPVN